MIYGPGSDTNMIRAKTIYSVMCNQWPQHTLDFFASRGDAISCETMITFPSHRTKTPESQRTLEHRPYLEHHCPNYIMLNNDFNADKCEDG